MFMFYSFWCCVLDNLFIMGLLHFGLLFGLNSCEYVFNTMFKTCGTLVKVYKVFIQFILYFGICTHVAFVSF